MWCLDLTWSIWKAVSGIIAEGNFVLPWSLSSTEGFFLSEYVWWGDKIYYVYSMTVLNIATSQIIIKNHFAQYIYNIHTSTNTVFSISVAFPSTDIYWSYPSPFYYHLFLLITQESWSGRVYNTQGPCSGSSPVLGTMKDKKFNKTRFLWLPTVGTIMECQFLKEIAFLFFF